MMIQSAIACNLDTNVLRAALPIFESAEVEAIEWSFDTLHQARNIPAWFGELLSTFSEGNGLIGHGVFFSLFSGEWTEDQARWLRHLKKVCSHYNFQHITEHFGFMTGANFHQGAPVSIPMTDTTLAIGQDRLKRIQQECQRPVGLENLAFTYSIDEVKKHGEFLDQLVQPVNGFIILDLHNLYCQMHNFQLPFEEIIKFYPLHRVREIHISGGSWQEEDSAPEQKVRRDTHDQQVPLEVFEILEKSLPMLPNLRYVVLEQIGSGLKNEIAQDLFRRDYRKMKNIVDAQNNLSHLSNQESFLPKEMAILGEPLTDAVLHTQQMELSNILETATSASVARQQLAASSLANSAWQIERWAPHMLTAVLEIAQKWKDGFQPNKNLQHEK